MSDNLKQLRVSNDAIDDAAELRREVGSLRYCPPEQQKKILKWLVLTYIGEQGGLTRFGHVRRVFYSHTGRI